MENFVTFRFHQIKGRHFPALENFRFQNIYIYILIFFIWLYIKSKYPILNSELILIQCYDKYLKKDYEKAEKKAGHSMLDLSKEKFGDYNSKPHETTFFKENGTYDTEKGKFFLEWYSNKLILHGDQILREANKIFTGLKIDLVAKVLHINTHAGSGHNLKKIECYIHRHNPLII